MKNDDVLNVWHEEALVGQLWQDATTRIGFRYDPYWLEHGFSISQKLPLSVMEYAPTEGIAQQFFANLLPEAAARMHIVRHLKVADSDFSLLKAIGGECAGALSILPVDYFLPKGASPSSHILKFEVAGFCQALGVAYNRKYQQDGGPSFRDCYRLVQDVSIRPIQDTKNLLKWQIFNVLAGNSDGHAKNLALIYNRDQQIQLAPFYDLVCTRAIARIDAQLALSVGGEFNPENITANNWTCLAEACDIRLQYLKNLVQQTAENLLNNLTDVTNQFESLHGHYPALQRVEKVITRQCAKIF